MDTGQKTLNRSFAGPLMFDYVWWVLHEAVERGLSRLYFLARDGYLLCEIARRFCDRFQLPVTCRYLYCSRASLRMPSYHLIGREAMELLTLGGYQVTLRSLLQRAQLDLQERQVIYESFGWHGVDETKILQRGELDEVRSLLAASELFWTYVQKKSTAAYGPAVEYLRQEGLLEGGEVAIVDSGWTGSMQRSLRQLLQAEGFKGAITGFYFGMYAAPKEACDGTYLTWFFNHAGPTGNKIPFCNNLFECLLSAPHGMTVSYRRQDDRYVPVLAPGYSKGQLEVIQQQIADVLAYMEERLMNTDFKGFAGEALHRETAGLIRRYMAHPTRAEAERYGRFLFCDDVTEAYHLKLADPEQVEALKGYLIPARILRRLFKRPVKRPAAELLWPYGTIAFLPGWKQWWYRLNVYVWELIRYARQ
jgi:hypothetical protein